MIFSKVGSYEKGIEVKECFYMMRKRGTTNWWKI
jgi:hypothetical protein